MTKTVTVPPVAFVVGVPRSGTSLLSFLLDQHPEVASPPEPWLGLALHAFARTAPRHPAESNLIGEGVTAFTEGLDVPAALARAGEALYAARAARDGKRLLVDKTPRYWQILPFLRRAFPQAPVIVILRNPFAVLASYKTTWNYRPLEPAETPFMTLDLALGFRHLADFLTDSASDPMVLAVRYEDLVGAEGDAVLARVQEHLGVAAEVTAATADFGRLKRDGAKGLGDTKIRETTGVHAASLDRWQDDLTPEEMQAGLDLWGTALLERLGYGAVTEAALGFGLTPRDDAEALAAAAPWQQDLETRWADLERTASHSPFVEKVREACDLAYADPHAVLDAPQVEAALRATMEQMDAAHHETHRRLAAEVERATALERTVSERDQRIAALEAELAAVHADAQRQLQEQQAVIGGLQERLAALKAFVAALQNGTVVGNYLRLRKITPPE